MGSDMSAQKDWELQKDKKGIKVWTKDYPDSKFKQFKATATLSTEKVLNKKIITTKKPS